MVNLKARGLPNGSFWINRDGLKALYLPTCKTFTESSRIFFMLIIQESIASLPVLGLNVTFRTIQLPETAVVDLPAAPLSLLQDVIAITPAKKTVKRVLPMNGVLERLIFRRINKDLKVDIIKITYP
jgi:hypothetical protein